MLHSTNLPPKVDDQTKTEPPTLVLPADTHPRLVAMVRQNFAALDPDITHPPPQALQ